MTTKGSIQQYQTTLTLTSIDKQKLGQVAAELHQLRKPDAYKGKGIRYAGVAIKLKPGRDRQDDSRFRFIISTPEQQGGASNHRSLV